MGLCFAESGTAKMLVMGKDFDSFPLSIDPFCKLPARWVCSFPTYATLPSSILMQGLCKRLGCSLRLAVLKLLRSQFLLTEGLGVRVQTQQDLFVLQRVLLLYTGTLGLGFSFSWAYDGLYFRRVDEAADVGVVDDVGGKQEVLLQRGWGSRRSVDFIQGRKSRRGPDDEASEVPPGCKLQEVEGENGRRLDTGNVPESTDELLAVFIRMVDNQWTPALAVTTTPKFSFPSTQFSRCTNFADVGPCTNSYQELDRR